MRSTAAVATAAVVMEVEAATVAVAMLEVEVATVELATPAAAGIAAVPGGTALTPVDADTVTTDMGTTDTVITDSVTTDMGTTDTVITDTGTDLALAWGGPVMPRMAAIMARTLLITLMR